MGWDNGDIPETDDEFYASLDYAQPGGRSALRAATCDNPRNLREGKKG